MCHFEDFPRNPSLVGISYTKLRHHQKFTRLCNTGKFPVTILLTPLHVQSFPISDAAFATASQLSTTLDRSFAIQRGRLHAECRPRLAGMAPHRFHFAA